MATDTKVNENPQTEFAFRIGRFKIPVKAKSTTAVEYTPNAGLTFDVKIDR